MLAGDVLLDVEDGRGGTGCGDAGLLNGNCPKPGFNPVGSVEVSTDERLRFSPQNAPVCTPPKPPLFWNDGVGLKPPKLPPDIPVGCDNMGPIEGKLGGCCS
jgi:hypothetical protein